MKHRHLQWYWRYAFIEESCFKCFHDSHKEIYEIKLQKSMTQGLCNVRTLVCLYNHNSTSFFLWQRITGRTHAFCGGLFVTRLNHKSMKFNTRLPSILPNKVCLLYCYLNGIQTLHGYRTTIISWMLPCCWQTRGEAIFEKGILDSIEDYVKRALMSNAEPTAVKCL